MARQRGYDIAKLAETTQNDPLEEFYVQKTFVFPPRPSVKLACDLIE